MSSIASDQPFCIDPIGEKTFDRTQCASPAIQRTVLFPSFQAPSKPIDELIAEFLGLPPEPIPTPSSPQAPIHDPVEVLTALYTIFQKLPEFLKIITESAVVTGTAMDQAYQGYWDARLELLNAQTQCAEFYESHGKTPCTMALRASVYALGKMRISLGFILAQDRTVSGRIEELFQDLTDEWTRKNIPDSLPEPFIEIPSGQPFLE